MRIDRSTRHAVVALALTLAAAPVHADDAATTASEVGPAFERARKNCDWLVANDVSQMSGTFGGDSNTVHLVTADGVESWPTLKKRAVAERLAERIAAAFQPQSQLQS